MSYWTEHCNWVHSTDICWNIWIVLDCAVKSGGFDYAVLISNHAQNICFAVVCLYISQFMICYLNCCLLKYIYIYILIYTIKWNLKFVIFVILFSNILLSKIILISFRHFNTFAGVVVLEQLRNRRQERRCSGTTCDV